MTALGLVLAVAAPLGLAVMAVLGWRRPLVSALLPAAPVPALAVALLAPAAEAGVVLPDLLLGVVLGLDPTARTFLWLTALLWIAAGVYSRTYLPRDEGRGRFDEMWLATLAGNLGLILAQDAAGFYAFFSLMTLASFGLVIHDGTPLAHRAGRVYIVLAVLGETCLLLGLMAASAAADGSLLLADLRAALGTAPDRDLILALLVVGFGIKAGTVPLHVWLPLAHPAAPTPASAVLSGAIIKAGIVGWLKFMPLGVGPGLPDWGAGLAALGLFTAYYGVLAGLPQRNPKTVLAYSSLSQMGLVLVIVAVALAEPSAAPVALAAAALYAVHHGLAKGALFLGVGVLGASGGARRWLVLAGQLVPALAIAGFPLTSGALAKAELKRAVEDGPAFLAGPVETLATLSAVGTTLLMARFLTVTARSTRPGDTAESATAPPAGLWVPWLATLLAAFAASWWLFVTGRGAGAVAYAAAPAHLWDGMWPVLIGTVVAAAAVALPSTGRRRLPRAISVPEGDLVALAPPIGRAAARLGTHLSASGSRLRDRSAAAVRRLTAGSPAERWSTLDERLRRPATTGLGLLLITALLMAMLR